MKTDPEGSSHQGVAGAYHDAGAGQANVCPARADYDVAVVGSGIGGMAACIALRRSGLSVVCIDPEPFPRTRVGESLDFSAPGLLGALGLSRDQLIDEQVGTPKRNIKVHSLGMPEFSLQIRSWLRNKPLRFEVATLHVDRTELDRRLFKVAETHGTSFLWDRVTTVEAEDDRVMALQTAGRRRITARWFIDGSGRAQVFGKAFSIGKTEYGQRKVCLWTHFDASMRNMGTDFYVDRSDKYFTWIWEIPVTPHRVSVGWVVPADVIKERRKQGKSILEILREEMARHPRLVPFLDQPGDSCVQTCSYRTYVYWRACGPNWLMVGEAASLPDPLSSNGVTAACRHAQDAACLIRESLGRGSLTPRQRRRYSTKVRRIGHAFNYSIETCLYAWPVRWGLGELAAVRAYIFCAFSLNALYTRVQPQRWLRWNLFELLLCGWQFFMFTCSVAGILVVWSRRLGRGFRENRLKRSQVARER